MESLRDELAASQKAFLAKMELSSAALEQEWRDRLHSQSLESEKNLYEATYALRQQNITEVEDLKKQHSEEVHALKGLLQKVRVLVP